MRWSGCTSRSKGVSLGGGNEAWVNIGSYTKYLNCWEHPAPGLDWGSRSRPGPETPGRRPPPGPGPAFPRRSSGIRGRRALPARWQRPEMRLSGTANLKSRQRGHFNERSSSKAGAPPRARPVLPEPPAPTSAAPPRSAARRAAARRGPRGENCEAPGWLTSPRPERQRRAERRSRRTWIIPDTAN